MNVSDDRSRASSCYIFIRRPGGRLNGAVSERLKEMVSKTIELVRVPGVRIPPAPNDREDRKPNTGRRIPSAPNENK